MNERISRKTFLRNAGRFVAGAAVGAAGSIALSADKAEGKATPWPWPYTKLDPEQARKIAHDAFYERGCCFAGFSGIVRLLQEQVGEPYTLLPLEMMSYGGAGVKGWGTLCGALNGASAAVSLVSDGPSSTTVINELMGWYTQESLPSATSNQYAETRRFAVDKGIKSLAQSVSGSPLCHISTTTWCVKAGYGVESPERLERCARLSGDVAAHAVKLLNDCALDQLRAEFVLPESTAGCLTCHGANQSVDNVAAKLQCPDCHGDPHK